MGASHVRALFRVSFTDYIPDPDDADCLRRSKTVPADRFTFDDEHLVLWLAETEVARFTLDVVEAVTVDGIPGTSQRESPDQIRSQHPNFGQPWTTEDEARLLARYREGQHDFESLAEEFGRQPSAIRSRLAKLGLKQL
ncbi:hypothetical protein ABZ467_37650 [Streptomyces sp. NPDC005727]|uniref:hypothetical protein n=1 Tax=Streptomyces sp. NPDC005727 TaxID=3157053 RepID=UPI0033FE3344